MDVSSLRFLEDVKWSYLMEADPPATTITIMFVGSVLSLLAQHLT